MFLYFKYRYLLLRIRRWVFYFSKEFYTHQLIETDILKLKKIFIKRYAAKSGKKKVLFASFLPLPYILKIEGTLSTALKQQKFDVECVRLGFNYLGQKYHEDVFNNKTFLLEDAFSAESYKAALDSVNNFDFTNINAVKTFRYKNCPVGINILASFSANDMTGDLVADKGKMRFLKDLMVRSCLYVDASEAMMNKIKPDIVIAAEKGFVGCCEIFYQALNKNKDYIQWFSCHEPDAIIAKRYTKENMRDHTFSVDKKTFFEYENFPKNLEEEVLNSFQEGYGKGKWFEYKKIAKNVTVLSPHDIAKQYGIDPHKKTVVIFAHILNDANLFYGDDLFPKGFRQWLVETVKAAAQNQKVNWVLKLHPANSYRRAMSGVSGEFGEITALKQELGSVPSWLRIIYPDDKINNLSLFAFLDTAITVRGTVGAEVPCFGKTVITAGTGRYSGLGFTYDSSSIEEYLEKIRNIDKLPLLSQDAYKQALKHAYLFFKVRPFVLSSFAKDNYDGKSGIFFRDLTFKFNNCDELAENKEINKFISWITHSKKKDFCFI